MKSRVAVYEPLRMDGYELCYPLRGDDVETINVQVNGTPRQSKWTPIPMRLVRKDEGRQLAISDSPWLGAQALVFRPNVVQALRSLLYEYGELLPLACDDAEVVMYNPTRVIDALDEGESSVVRFNNGKLMQIRRHVFRGDRIAGVDVFKIPNLRVSPTFLSQRFVDRWNESGLHGLEFERVWWD